MLSHMKERPGSREVMPIFTPEELAGKQLEKKFQRLFAGQADREDLLVTADILIHDLKMGQEPDFDLMPEGWRGPVKAAWMDQYNQLIRFKEDQADARAAMTVKKRDQRVHLQLQETAERAKRMGELEEKFGEIPDAKTPLPQRQIATQIVRKPEKKGAVRRFFDRLAGNP